MTQLSPNFTLEQFTYSDTALHLKIDNSLPEALLPNAKLLAEHLEQVQIVLGHGIILNSVFRNDELNVAIGGSKLSNHRLCLAADIVCPAFGTPLDVCNKLIQDVADFDQIIYEYKRWCHFGISLGTMRREPLTIFSAATGYQPGILTA